MKIAFIILYLFAFHVQGIGQTNPLPDSSVLKDTTKTPQTDSIGIPKGQTTELHVEGHNMYGDLLNDDPVYNRRYPLWVPATRVAFTNVVNWTVVRYLFKYDWAKISPTTWKNNLRGPWVWDNDRFGINFIGHPHTGNYFFNTARSNGYNFWQSFPFAVGGSVMWELFGEKDPPSKNDVINTPISGMFLGEVLYRISSNILDDRTRGGNRVFRELLAGFINPPRAFNRLTQGKMFRVTSKEVYQKEPLNITFSVGMHKVNTNNHFGTGATNVIANLQFDYGDPFEIRHRKPFDVFRFRIESRYGDEKKIIDNVTGYGILFGKNIIKGKHGILVGLFQNFDYWNNRIFELGTLGFGAGIISRIHLSTHSNLYSGFRLAGVPLAGYSTRFGPDTSLFRDYSFGGGMEAAIEETLNVGKWVSAGFSGYFYWLSTYSGLQGSNVIGILKPRITFRLFNNTSLGFEHHIYYNNRYTNEGPGLRLARTEQKIFLQFYLEDARRKGQYH
ncbi:MAG: DUF3943 domain-containing protein [Chitinophagaceae bacterium]